MKPYKKLCIVVMTLGFAGSLFSADAAGGYSPVPVSNKDVIAAAEFAVTAQEKAINDLKDSTPSKLTLAELLSAQQQVVAGMNFRMKLKVKVGGVEKQAEAVVWWQAWRKQDPYRLTRWTWDNSAAMMSAPPKDWMKWAEWIDKRHPVDDGKGHGPDIGSGEWARALAHQLGVADKGGHGPDLGSPEWRRGVERKLLTRRTEQDGAGQPSRPMAFEPPTLKSEPLNIGSRRELFVDNYIIGALRGGAKRKLFEMTPATTETMDVAMTHDADWEGSWCRYAKYIQDRGVIKAWYMGHHTSQFNKERDINGGRMCYAVSKDGRTFKKPNLGLYDWKGSKTNNVVFDDITFKAKDDKGWIVAHQFNPFIDTNPSEPPAARYKGFSGQGHHCGKTGLYAYKSADGIHWEIASDGPIVSSEYSLDSCNQGFWDAQRKRYAVYFRHLRNERGESGIKAPGWKRDILVTFSKDFIIWTDPQWLIYHRDDGRPGMELENLYTNEVKPYKRAPHIYLGFPARFNGSVEPMLMASRDGIHFYRWMEHPLILNSAPSDRDKIRSNHLWQEMAELPGEPDKFSMYASENLGIKGPHVDGSFPRVRRFTIRKDGFVSVRAKAQKGELVTKLLIFAGDKLTVNSNAQLGEGGSVRVEILDDQQHPFSDFTIKDCDPFSMNEIDATVTWKGRADVSALAGKPIHLRFVLNDADLFSFRFTE